LIFSEFYGIINYKYKIKENNMKEPVITWDKTTKEAKCIIDSNYGEIIGIAKCHPDDYDLGNELTGCYIAS